MRDSYSYIKNHLIIRIIRNMFAQKISEFKSKYLNKKLIFSADILISVLSSLSLILFMNLLAASKMYSGRFFWIYMALSSSVSVFMLYITKCYKIIIRHLGIKDLIPFSIVAFIKALFVLAGLLITDLCSDTVCVIILLDFFLTFFALIGVRIIMIVIYEAILSRVNEKKEYDSVLVYGISDKSVATILRLKNSSHFKIRGFLVKGHETKGASIEQLPVFCFRTVEDFKIIAKENEINALLFAKDNEARDEEENLIKYCNLNKIKTLIIPNVDEFQEGQSIIKPREIKVEDLLGRQEIKISMDLIKANLSNKVVLVTGAAGSIGSELVRNLAGFGVKELILYDNAETPMHYLRLELEDKFHNLDFIPIIGDVRHTKRLDYIFRTFKPQVVFHAAAYKHVPLMEENPCEAILVNTIGTKNVADKCKEYEVEKMIMISTDKAVNPTNIMGCTKRIAEIYVQSLGLAIEQEEKEGKTIFVTTRFGNVLGSNGSVIPRFREQIEAGGPLTVTHPNINRFFMTIPEACRLVMEAATMATSTQIYLFDMGKPVKIDTLARRMITLAGFIPDKEIKIEYTGLRPGEKLYEETLSDTENTLPTFHERIRIAKVREYDYNKAIEVLNLLENYAKNVQVPEMVLLMKQIVPEYKSANSQYTAFDKDNTKN